MRVTSGFFEEAYGGTLFLDEIAQAPLTVQAKIFSLDFASEENKKTEIRMNLLFEVP